MNQYDHLQEKILRIDNELYEKAKLYPYFLIGLKKIPGINDVLAIGILAEATNDMSHFEDERKFAA